MVKARVEVRVKGKVEVMVIVVIGGNCRMQNEWVDIGRIDPDSMIGFQI